MNGKKANMLLPRDVLTHALIDRQWHRMEELWEALCSFVPPENAARFFRERTTTADKYSETYSVEHGKRLVVAYSFNSFASATKRIEVDGPKSGPDRRLRLNGWHCASCGAFIPEPWESRPSHCCCNFCVKEGTPCENQA